ncbi:DUF4232 domain-containing protein [Streptomyces sp. NPDC006267]|uniref:DUF4232 domain-containing protein n=1 Tax=Streptomyces sp. NPDC006267 TaxID=3157173 RepID=UPI0033BDBD8B
MRTFRNRTTVLAATTAAVLALALTACGDDGTGTRSAGSPPSGSTAAVAPETAGPDTDDANGAGTDRSTATDAGTAQTAGAPKGSGTAGGSGTVKKAPGAAPASARLCAVKDVAISAARQDGPPYTHLVLTAKNTSGTSCRIGGYPRIQFLESHREDVPAVAKSRPEAPVVLTPGAPAHALVRLSNGGVDEDDEVVTDFSVMLEGGNGQAAVRAPGKGGIAVDPAKWATGYWTYELRNGADDF